MAHDSILRPIIATGGAAVAEPELELTEGTTLERTAERDLESTLQLLAERAQFLTAASGVIIALREEDEMVCRAISGTSFHQLEMPLPSGSGLSAECLRVHQLVRCDNVEKAPHADLESYRALGIRSALALPLAREREVVGVVELTADRQNAFEEQDVAALGRLSEMILTAVDYADSAKRAMKEIAALEVAAPVETPLEPLAVEETPAPPALVLRRCEVCGFPISEERTVCLDCEETGRAGETVPASFLSQVRGGDESWLEKHMYTLATLFMVVLTVFLLALKLR